MATLYNTVYGGQSFGNSNDEEAANSLARQNMMGRVPAQAGISLKGTSAMLANRFSHDPNYTGKRYPLPKGDRAFIIREGDLVFAKIYPSGKGTTGDIIHSCFSALDGMPLGKHATTRALAEDLWFVGVSKSVYSPKDEPNRMRYTPEGFGILASGTATITSRFPRAIKTGMKIMWILPTLAEAEHLARTISSKAEVDYRIRPFLVPFDPYEAVNMISASYRILLSPSNTLGKGFHSIYDPSDPQGRRVVSYGDRTIDLAAKAKAAALATVGQGVLAMAARNLVKVVTPKSERIEDTKDALLAAFMEYFISKEASGDEPNAAAIRNMNYRGGKLPGYTDGNLPVPDSNESSAARKATMTLRKVMESYLAYSDASNEPEPTPATPSMELLGEQYTKNRTYFTEGVKIIADFNSGKRILMNPGDKPEEDVVRHQRKLITDGLYISSALGLIGNGAGEIPVVTQDILNSVYVGSTPNAQTRLLYTLGSWLRKDYTVRLSDKERVMLEQLSNFGQNAQNDYLGSFAELVSSLNARVVGTALNDVPGNGNVEANLDVGLRC